MSKHYSNNRGATRQPSPSPSRVDAKSVQQLQTEYDSLANECAELTTRRRQRAAIIRREVEKEVAKRLDAEFDTLPSLMEKKKQAFAELNSAKAESQNA